MDVAELSWIGTCLKSELSSSTEIMLTSIPMNTRHFFFRSSPPAWRVAFCLPAGQWPRTRPVTSTGFLKRRGVWQISARRLEANGRLEGLSGAYIVSRNRESPISYPTLQEAMQLGLGPNQGRLSSEPGSRQNPDMGHL